jgi:tRNA (guanine37-N1)-methyltransferase
LNFYVLTLFPDMVSDCLSYSVTGRAIRSGAITVTCVNIRDFAQNKHRSVDDYPYGGGAGMILRPWPAYRAYEYARKLANASAPVIYLTPQGATFRQEKAKELAAEKDIILLCGHYEGIDERLIEEIVDAELSIGDYVLTGGETAAIVVIDAVSRLVPGVLSENSTLDETFENRLVEYPQYTRPPEFLGRHVPETLLSGHHANVEKWRREQAILRTKAKRPDLIKDDDNV